ncbi:MAG: FAD binding domain-containing protein [Vicinamibacterales bacterium]
MKRFTNVNPRTMKDAFAAIGDGRQSGRHVSVAGGGTDLLQLMRERIVTPDVLVNLKTVQSNKAIAASTRGVTIGGLATLTSVSSDDTLRKRYTVLAEAAESVATPQIRNVGTLAGNVCQRPWCWYCRNGFKCFKNGGNACFSAAGENEFHAIFGGGPSFIVHPSDTAVALVALDASFALNTVRGERVVPARDFFALPTVNPAVENVLADGELLSEIRLPTARAGVKSSYTKVLDRETWTHAVVSAAVVLRMEGFDSVATRAWCSEASHRSRGRCQRSTGCWPASGSPSRSRPMPASWPSPTRVH